MQKLIMKSSRLFPLSYLFQKNQYKCDIVPSLPTGLCGIEPVEHAPFTTLPTAKRGGVAAVQIHTGHVQERPVTAQYHAPNLFPFAVPRPLAEMGIHALVAQNPPREDG